MNLKQILRESSMSTSPSFYSGRGATTSDLNYKILTSIASKIEFYISAEAKKNFVDMVADIPKLSATDFLITLYRLEANNWIWDKQLLSSAGGISVDGEVDAFATVMSVMGGMSSTNETIFIRSVFLAENGKESKEDYESYFDFRRFGYGK